MHPFEDLIHSLGVMMEIPLKADQHQSCLITFQENDLAIQIDLDVNGDRILIGSQLGRITPGTYRERIFAEALRVNGTVTSPKGILSFSEKNDTLVLFQFLNLAFLTGEKLHAFLQQFREHASIWKLALARGDMPQITIEGQQSTGGRIYGLKP
jgi:Tir chaperone protein (CesT) family